MNSSTKATFQGSFFAFLLLLSGFAGISYELLYARMLGNLIGRIGTISGAPRVR
jgi:hypothetical protein